MDRIKITFIIDKNVQSETEISHKNTCVNQLSLAHFKKKDTPATRNRHIEKSTENFSRIHMAIKALYNSKILEYRDN